jgi:hypothetical protein
MFKVRQSSIGFWKLYCNNVLVGVYAYHRNTLTLLRSLSSKLPDLATVESLILNKSIDLAVSRIRVHGGL